MQKRLLKQFLAGLILVAMLFALVACVDVPNSNNPQTPSNPPQSDDDPIIGGDPDAPNIDPPSGGDNPVTPPSGGDNPVTPPSGGDDPVTPPSGGDDPVTPPGGGDDNPNPPSQEDPVTPPVIPDPVSGAVEIIAEKSGGDLEVAYVSWKIDQNAKWYTVYVKASSAAESAYVKLDAPLVRKYATYFRADAVGLKAGKYDMKVVPVNHDNSEDFAYASEIKNITVKAHERMGFAFVNGTSSGAYSDDGVLLSNAVVLYITEKTKDTISMNVAGANANPCVGLETILEGYKKGKETRPLAVRLVGNITDLAVMEKGDIVVENKNNAKCGITIEGIGEDATVNGWGIRVKNASNVEIRNLGFMNTDSNEGDDIGLQQDNDHVWVHNCDLFYGKAGSDADQVKGDGALDTKKSTYVTHSYNHFWDCGKCNLQGMSSETATNYITYHHNWFDHSDSRHPRIRTCTVHIFNNYYDGNAKYGVGATCGCSVFVENNYFRSESTMRPMLISQQGTDILDDPEAKGTFSGENGGIIKSYGNYYEGNGRVKIRPYSETNTVDFDCYEASSRDEQVPASVVTKKGGTSYNNFDTASTMYSYVVDSPEVAKEKVQQYAGRINGGDFKYEFPHTAEVDGNYDVDRTLQQALVSYQTTVEEIGGDAAASIPSQGEQGGESGGESGETPSVPTLDGAISSDFAGGRPSNPIFTVTGNAKNANMTINEIGQTFSSGLKIESATSITLTVSQTVTLTLYLDGGAGKNIVIDGTKVKTTTNSSGDTVVVIVLEAGTHTITKGDSINLWYATIVPQEDAE